MSAEHAVPLPQVARRPTQAPAPGRDRRLRAELRVVRVVWRREVVRFRRSPARVAAGLLQPLLLLLVFGVGLSPVVDAGASYETYVFPGALALTVVGGALGSAASLVWDREFGFVRAMLVAPVNRTSILLGKVGGGTTTALLQGLFMLALAPVVGVPLDPLRVAAAAGVAVLLALALTAVGLALATRVDRIESFQAVMGFLLGPLMFLSGAMFPLDDLPRSLAIPTYLNPVTYGVDAMRRVVLHGQESAFGTVELGGVPVPLWAELAAMAVLTVALLGLAAARFSRPR